jgi:hypothetical protein
MLLLSMRFGALADRHGPRFFMGVGPLVAAAGLALLLRVDADVKYLTDLLPALLPFALGLSMTVAPLTATGLADADEQNAGIASGVTNAIARGAALVPIAAVGAVVAAHFRSQLDSNLGRLSSRPVLKSALSEARRQPLARVARTRYAAVPARASRAIDGGGVGARLPRRDRRLHGLRGPRRRARPGWHTPAPPGSLRGLYGRSAGQGSQGRLSPVPRPAAPGRARGRTRLSASPRRAPQTPRQSSTLDLSPDARSGSASKSTLRTRLTSEEPGNDFR